MYGEFGSGASCRGSNTTGIPLFSVIYGDRAALAGDPARRAAMGAKGRRRAETEFASERINEETLRVYERALALGR